MGDTALEREISRRSIDAKRWLGSQVRRLREDADLSMRQMATAIGIDPSHLMRIERGDVGASIEVIVGIAVVLGCDPSIRLYPTTGPRIHDRFQAPMTEGLFGELHKSWRPHPEIGVRHPARGIIDAVLLASRRPAVATEFHSEIRRLEQQVAWHRLKADSLPSSELWSRLADAPPSIERLLVLRSTRSTRALARTYEQTLRSAYPARTREAIASLVDGAPWPGPAIVWMRVEGPRGWLMDGPPPTIRLGR